MIVSAYAMLLVRDHAVRADRLVQKPFDPKELLERVNQVVKCSPGASVAAAGAPVGLIATAENEYADGFVVCTDRH